MADVKWIKITTDMFDNRKIKHLRKLPEGNNIVLIWVMLLTMAGRCNAGGMIFLTENIPYTTKMLADELGFEENTVKLALQALEQLNMIFTKGDYFLVSGWSEHQNNEGMEKIREQTRKRVAKHREKQKLLLCNVTSNDTLTESNAIDIEEDIEKEKEKDNSVCLADFEKSDRFFEKKIEKTPHTKKSKNKNQKENPKNQHGEFMNVLLTEKEYWKLKTDYSDMYERYIEKLSTFMKSSGKKYENHYATIKRWIKEDKAKEEEKAEKQEKPKGQQVNNKNRFNNFQQREYDFDAYERMLLNEKNPPKTAGESEEIRERAEALKERLS